MYKTNAGNMQTEYMPVTLFIKYDNNDVEFIGAENREVKFGDIWMAQLPDKDGSVQGGHRPVFVISNNKNNQYSTVINVIPLTSKMFKKNLPCHVKIWDYEKYGLRSPSTILVEQLTTISKENLRFYIGEIDDHEMLLSIYDAMKIQFPILDCLS